MDNVRVAVDAMGGDYAPASVVSGAVQAVKSGVDVTLVGDRQRIEEELKKHDIQGLSIPIVHASEVVGMAESPAQAIRNKKDSSIRVCFELVKEGRADAVVSAGNSGSALAAGIMVLKRLKGVNRPAIAVCVPTMMEPAVVLDVGGNVDCKPLHLLQFALMGSIYAKYVLDKERPRVGLLSNGEEEEKGNELTKQTHELLKKTSLNYVGYIEGKDIYRGGIDVVVTDGFVGNVVLKLSEGLVETVVRMLKKEIKARFLAKLGYILAKPAFDNLKKKIDYAEYGGAPLLGIDGVCIISHGASSSKAIKNAILRAREYVESGVNSCLIKELSNNRDLEELTQRQPA